MAFLDPSKPLATCSSETCEDCGISDRIHCHFRPLDLIHFFVIALPGFLLGGKVILDQGSWWFVLWIGICVLYFGVVEIRVMCSHCPHYAEDGPALSCWANHGSPKFWKYRPGPMSVLEKIVFLGGFVVIWGFPIGFYILAGSWFFLFAYLVCVAGFFMTLLLFFCTRCMNFACPLNAVDQGTRREFLQKNPMVGDAWGEPQD